MRKRWSEPRVMPAVRRGPLWAGVLCLGLLGCEVEPTPFVIPDGGFACNDMPPLPQNARIELSRVFTSALRGRVAREMVQVEPSPVERDRYYVVTRPGRIYTFVEGEAATEVLDLSDDIWEEYDEEGLMSLAFAPDFEQSGLVYVLYATPTPEEQPDVRFISRIARFHSRDGGLTLERGSEEVVFDIPQPGATHSVNFLRFGPDGYLYVSLGDGESPYDRRRHGQNEDTLYAAILRIDPSEPDEARGTAYSIPEDNPFRDGDAPELYAMGLRNPWRFSFDRETGEIWAGDVGQDSREEIDRIVRGGNYGWSAAEGTVCIRDEHCDERDDLIPPYYEYSHSEGSSVTGGYVYRGDAVKVLRGRYVFADFISGKIWSLETDAEPGRAEATLLLESGYNLASFFEDREGELYVVRFSRGDEGAVYRIDPAPKEGIVELELSQTGCVQGEDPRKPIARAVPYEVRAPLWSDGAEKSRAIVLPEGGRAEIDGDGDFRFPAGTVLIKTFGYDGDIHETRLFVRHARGGWVGYSFEWNEERSDARLLTAGKRVELKGGLSWRYPSRGDCMQCHRDAAGVTLGPELLQLGGGGGGGTSEALDALVEQGLFGPLEDVEALSLPDVPALPDPFDEEGAPRARRARAYLHVNCSNCHRPGVEGIQAEIDLRFTTSFEDTGTCGLEPELGDLYGEVADAEIIKPGYPEESVLYRRMTTLSRFRMPAVGSHIVDERGAALIEAWIEGLDGCP